MSQNARVEIHVNGIVERIVESLLLDELIAQKGLDRRFLVVEHNGVAVPREDFEGLTLHEGDRLELVRPVAGG
jgi:thiamine biosynthesis protein ThiS